MKYILDSEVAASAIAKDFASRLDADLEKLSTEAKWKTWLVVVRHPDWSKQKRP